MKGLALLRSLCGNENELRLYLGSDYDRVQAALGAQAIAGTFKTNVATVPAVRAALGTGNVSSAANAERPSKKRKY